MNWDSIAPYLRPYTLRKIREDIRNIENPTEEQIAELSPALAELTEMLVNLYGDNQES